MFNVWSFKQGDYVQYNGLEVNTFLEHMRCGDCFENGQIIGIIRHKKVVNRNTTGQERYGIDFFCPYGNTILATIDYENLAPVSREMKLRLMMEQ